MSDEREEIIALLKAHIRADATGLAPAVIGHYLVGFEAAADAILARAQGPGEAVAWRVKDFADGWTLYANKDAADVAALASSGALIEPLYAATPTREA